MFCRWCARNKPIMFAPIIMTVRCKMKYTMKYTYCMKYTHNKNKYKQNACKKNKSFTNDLKTLLKFYKITKIQLTPIYKSSIVF